MQNNVAYDVVLNTSHQAYMPPEIGAGRCTMMLYGSNGSIKATTNFLEFTIDQSLQITGSQTHDLTPTLYDQFCAYVDRKFKEIVDSVENKNIEPIKIGKLINKILNSKKPKYVYNINRNILLRLLSILPKRFQVWVIKKIIK